MPSALRTSAALIRVSLAAAAPVVVADVVDVVAVAVVSAAASAVAAASVPVLAAVALSVVVRVRVTARMLRGRAHSRARARRLIRVSVVQRPMRAQLSLDRNVRVARVVRAAVRVAVSVAGLFPARALNKVR